jgi:predicted metal-dependent phosphoesterase TrpH
MTDQPWFKFSITGHLPEIITDRDPAPVAEQIEKRYAHGGGFMPFNGFDLSFTDVPGKAFLQYPGDPPYKELARIKIRDETVILFPHSWVCIVQLDGSFAVTRMD